MPLPSGPGARLLDDAASPTLLTGRLGFTCGVDAPRFIFGSLSSPCRLCRASFAAPFFSFALI